MPWDRDASRHARGYGYQWQKVRQRVLMRDAHLCQPCLHKGRPTPATQVDHIIPKSKGGTDEPENLQAICDDCHTVKTAEDSGYRARRRIGADGWPSA